MWSLLEVEESDDSFDLCSALMNYYRICARCRRKDGEPIWRTTTIGDRACRIDNLILRCIRLCRAIGWSILAWDQDVGSSICSSDIESYIQHHSVKSAWHVYTFTTAYDMCSFQVLRKSCQEH